MKIDWVVVSTLAAPILTLFIGIWAARRFGDRAKLISFYGHVATFRHTPPNGRQLIVNTHAVVLRNTGRQAATNVRLSHSFLPDFNIFPAVQHSVEELPGGVKDIVIPTLVPGEQIIVSYLYFAPQTVDKVNAGIKCDQGFAQQISVLLQRQYSKQFSDLLRALVIIGVIAFFYALYDVGHMLTRLLSH